MTEFWSPLVLWLWIVTFWHQAGAVVNVPGGMGTESTS